MLFQSVLGSITNPTPAQDLALFTAVGKWIFMTAFGVYVVFAFIITRQIDVMKKTLITSFSPLFTLLGYLHLLAAILIFLMFFILL